MDTAGRPAAAAFIREAHQAKTEMVEANLRPRYFHRERKENIRTAASPSSTIIQEGNMGLMKGRRKIRIYRRGYKFSTYAHVGGSARPITPPRIADQGGGGGAPPAPSAIPVHIDLIDA